MMLRSRGRTSRHGGSYAEGVPHAQPGVSSRSEHHPGKAPQPRGTPKVFHKPAPHRPRPLHLCACLFSALLWLLALPSASATPLPDFTSDEEAHQWLRKKSHYYDLMADDIDQRGGIRFGVFENPVKPGGMMENRDGKRRILLSNDLKGPSRLSILIFELTNAYQEKVHQEIDSRVRSGAITSPVEFGILHELVEYDGLRYHRFVLTELNAVIDGGIPRDMLTWINPKLTDLASYEIPLAFEYIETQAKSGHTAHYHKWFWTQKGRQKAHTR